MLLVDNAPFHKRQTWFEKSSSRYFCPVDTICRAPDNVVPKEPHPMLSDVEDQGALFSFNPL